RRHWLRLSRSNGTLSVVDDYLTSGGAAATKLAVDASGTVYVAGEADTIQGNGAHRTTTYNWVVRRRLAGQSSFTTADNFTTPGNGAGALAVTTVAAGPSAGVYVVGDDSATNGSQNWIVRKSVDAGSTWAIVDTFELTSGVGSNTAQAVAADGAGNLFVAGSGSAPSNLNLHWLVRTSSGGGLTCSTGDKYRLDATHNAVAIGAGVDGGGNIYVTGYGYDPANIRHAILRSN